MYLPSRTSSELHKLSKIEMFSSALRAEMFPSQDLLRATQTFENQHFSLGASRRNVHYKGALQGALQGYTTRFTFKISLGFPA